ncbi:hypothetical protein BJX70DRAFT_388875 [Aspergillus crustosus]
MSYQYTGISLQVTVYLAEEDIDTFFNALGSVFNQIASDPYCTIFEILMLTNWSSTREWLVDVGMRRPYLDEYHAIVEPLFLRPKDIRILDRKGGKWSILKTSNGRIWDGDGDGDDDQVKGTKIGF